ncbi:MAG: asparagine synthase (glutamine-hydrolyzing) [Candidatus Acidiferrum sp.]
MCGICGIVDTRAGRHFTKEELSAMARVIRHRGPDDQGELVSGPVGFGFRRLSIVDLKLGHQPMPNEDGTVWIIFNGEIYNHAELRPDLEQRGHRYATTSDTETIIHLYEEYGVDCVDRLRGMFAFAIWDIPRQRLFCARDRLGIKPFYYANLPGMFLFASEIKSLFQIPGVRPQLNRQAIPEFLAFGYLSSDETLFSGVRRLMPGHRFVLDLKRNDAQPKIEKYWDLELSTIEGPTSERDQIARFQQLFEETVSSHLMSDVPLGVFLSGGLDSSAIAAVMASLRKDTIQTFSVGYAEQEYSELPYARMVAKHIGAEYNEIILGPSEFYSSLPNLIWHEDEPLVWPSSVALHFVSRLASEKVKVVLTGEGGDEIFAGYLKYRMTLWNLQGAPLYRKMVPDSAQALIRAFLESNALPDVIRRKLRHTFLYYPDTFEQLYFDNFYSIFPQSVQSSLLTPGFAQELGDSSAYASAMKFLLPERKGRTTLDRLLYLDIKTYLVELLMKQDQMSMSTSLESRVPLLDHKVVEFAMGIPADQKVRYMSGKYLLRKSMTGRLPAAILNRTKKGFPTPIRPWLRTVLFEKVAAVLTDARFRDRELFRAEFVDHLLEEHRGGSSPATEGVWRLLNFELWCRIFLDGEMDASVIQTETAHGPATVGHGSR